VALEQGKVLLAAGAWVCALLFFLLSSDFFLSANILTGCPGISLECCEQDVAALFCFAFPLIHPN
jgi:hypothetical protein